MCFLFYLNHSTEYTYDHSYAQASVNELMEHNDLSVI